ncbi:MAG: DUF4349 domain-containing protein [Dehalococcoidia bacterium]
MFNNLLKRTAFILLIISILALAGCSFLQSSTVNQASKSYTPPFTTSAAMPPAPTPSMARDYGAGESYGTVAVINATDQTTDRKIVRTGSATLEVVDIDKTLDSIAALAVQYNGYVVSSNRYNGDQNQVYDKSIIVPTTGSQGGDISLRVPADKFDEVMQKLNAMAVKVQSENTNSQDLTEQYTDLQAQLKNQQAAEAQYLDILKKADNVKDILAVQQELTTVRGNIESLQGRIQYLERTSDMSMIQVSLVKSRPIGESTWDITGIFKSAVDGLITFGKALLSVLIWLLVFSPIWIIILVVVWLILRYRRKLKKA